MGILVASLSILLFVFSLGQLARVDITPSIAITGLDIVVGGFVIGWGLWKMLRKNLVWSSVWKSWLLFLGFAAFSLLLTIFSLPPTQKIAAILYLLRFTLYGGLFFLVFSYTPIQKKALKIIMTIAGALLVGSGYVQFFLYPALRNLYYAGWDQHYYRMFGTFLDPNFLGLFFVLYVLFLLYLFFNELGKRRLIYLVLSLFTVGAVYLTYSRSALIALVIGITTFLLIKGNNKKIAAIIVGLILLGSITTFTISANRSEGTNFFRKISSEARIGNMRDALTVWQDNIIFGVGFNAYRYAQFRHGIYKGGWDEGHGTAGADNSFLFVLATTGLVGLGAFLYFLSQHIKALLKQKNIPGKSLGIASLVAISIGSFFINGLFYPSLMVWLWLILGVTESK